jgi:hypothetical protein
MEKEIYMFEFIKSLFRKKSSTYTAESKCPFLSDSQSIESIDISEVVVIDVKPKKPRTVKPKVTNTVTETPPAIAKGVNPAAKKPAVKAEPAKIVQLVQPTPAKKKGRPKKDKV